MFYGSLTTKPSIYDQLCGQASLFQCLLSWCLNRSCVTALVGTLNMEFPKIMKDFANNTAPRAQIQQLGNLIFYSCKSKFRR